MYVYLTKNKRVRKFIKYFIRTFIHLFIGEKYENKNFLNKTYKFHKKFFFQY